MIGRILRSAAIATAAATLLSAGATAAQATTSHPGTGTGTGTGAKSTGTRAASCGAYVVASVPLTDTNTGVTLPYSDGYVQLWYNSCTSDNYAHVVSELRDTTYVYAEVDRSDGAYAWASSTTSTSVWSPSLYSPVLKDSAYGYVVADGVGYYGQTLYY